MATTEVSASEKASTQEISFSVNGRGVQVTAQGTRRLSRVLRDDLGLTGTKVGCDAGDCGACTVLLDGEPACACLIAAGQIEGCEVTTVEGLAERSPFHGKVQQAFLSHGAAQCGACTPGMLVAATALLEKNSSPNEEEVMDAIGGVLCRCTGYRKIISAIMQVGSNAALHASPEAGAAVGARLVRIDGKKKVDGTEIFGADETPALALALRVIRSPHHCAKFEFGDLKQFVDCHPGITWVLTAKDVPGIDCYGVIPKYADQPVFAHAEARYRGEAVAAVVGESGAIESIDLAEFPVRWEALPALKTIDDGLATGAPLVHEHREGNVLVRGRVVCGDVEKALSEADSQSPYMDRDDIAKILGIPSQKVRIIPTAVGGGFGSKLDLSVQPFVALAAWKLDRPVRMLYSRTESIISTTKRHPAHMRLRAGATHEGRLTALDFAADFNTGAYSSWGPTVAARVPVHASGPYRVPNYRAVTCAVHTNLVPAGAFRGFGVPQAAIAQEQLYDDLADKVGMDRLEFRILNCLDDQTPTVTGQVLGEGVGIRACFESLRPKWRSAREAAAQFNAQSSGPVRRGVGVAGMWYGCGNTSLPNPSTVRIGLKANGRIALHQGAVDIGQGSNTVVTQICADALGAPIAHFDLVSGDTAITPDCGKTSASRQTFVTGNAAFLAGKKLRVAILKKAGACDCATIEFGESSVTVTENGNRTTLALGEFPLDANRYVITCEATFDPPTSPLDENGQGNPYAVFGFGAHMAEIEVDVELGTVKVLKVTAAHDVGCAINPTLIEGQIEGGVAQGLGMALMEEFFPGKGENLHDYLIPTAGDIPPVESILIEAKSPLGPFGAKGIGEQAVIPTAPAILNALHDAIGIRLPKIPATPDRVRAAILAKAAGGQRA